MKQTKWFERKFDFSSNQNIFPSIIERLAGTPARLEVKIRKIAPGILSIKIDGGWSIKENIGHLTDLESLWQARLDDLNAGRKEMTAADLQNTNTNEANHNNKSGDQLLHEFRAAREETISRLKNIEDELVFRSALHPRLKTPMRTLDLFLFVAEHDDHHLATISELNNLLSQP